MITSISFLLYIEVELIYNIVLVSGVQQSSSVLCIVILSQILFSHGLLQNTE